MINNVQYPNLNIRNIAANKNIQKNEINQTVNKKSSDIISITDNIEESIIKRGKLSLKDPKTIYSGTINNKQTYIEGVTKGLFKIKGSYKGIIDNKPINFNQEGRNIIGSYNNIDFDLKFENKIFNPIKITGTINGEEISFEFPGSKIPEDSATQDLLTMFLMLNGYKASAKNGEYKKLQLSNWSRKEQEMALLYNMNCK